MMAELSPEDRNIISQHPLHYIFSRAKLRDAAKFTVGSYNNRFRDAILTLLTDLIHQDAAFELSSKTGPGSLALELLTVHNCIRSCTLSHEHFRPLARSVLDENPDDAIWGLIFNLLHSLTPVMAHFPPGELCHGIPATRSSLSSRQSQKARQRFEDDLFREFHACTFCRVEGFYEKYFERKSWEEHSTRIFTRVQLKEKVQGMKWYDCGYWTELPNRPTKTKIWNWFAQFQSEFLPNAPNLFHTTMKPKDLSSPEARCQVDMFMKKRPKNSDLSEDTHNWRDILVIGVLKRSPQDIRSILLQLSQYARCVFTAQPTRHFLHAFTLQGSLMELWVFDRSGPYSSGQFNIHEEPKKFIRTVTGYAYMDDVEHGLGTFVKRQGKDCFIPLNESIFDNRTKLMLEQEPFVRQCSVVSRGTTCYRTGDRKKVVKFSWAPDKKSGEPRLLWLAKERGVEGIASFIGYKRLTDIDELRSGMDFPRPHDFKSGASSTLHCHAVPPCPTSQKPNAGISEHLNRGPERSSKRRRYSLVLLDRKSGHQPEENVEKTKTVGQDWMRGKESRTVITTGQAETDNREKALMETAPHVGDLTKSKPRNRIFGCLVISPIGRPLYTFTSVEELLVASRDAVRAHRSLYLKGHILHGDVSENNIIITNPTESGGFVGMLIDLDLAKEIDPKQPETKHRVGTIAFAAIEVLEKGVHTYRHDLESFLYVLIWICARQAWDVKSRCLALARPERDVLKKWQSKDFKEVANAKRGHMDPEGFEDVLKQFPEPLEKVQNLCRKMREILFPFSPGIGLHTGTHTCAEELYAQILAAYDDALKTLAP